MSAFCPEGCPDADACVVGYPCALFPRVAPAPAALDGAPDTEGERDYEGHLIGEDGLVAGPGGQRLKPVKDPWPQINQRRQQDGSA